MMLGAIFTTGPSQPLLVLLLIGAAIALYVVVRRRNRYAAGMKENATDTGVITLAVLGGLLVALAFLGGGEAALLCACILWSAALIASAIRSGPKN